MATEHVDVAQPHAPRQRHRIEPAVGSDLDRDRGSRSHSQAHEDEPDVGGPEQMQRDQDRHDGDAEPGQIGPQGRGDASLRHHDDAGIFAHQAHAEIEHASDERRRGVVGGHIVDQQRHHGRRRRAEHHVPAEQRGAQQMLLVALLRLRHQHTVPVSYTHLDVYKRQLQYLPVHVVGDHERVGQHLAVSVEQPGPLRAGNEQHLQDVVHDHLRFAHQHHADDDGGHDDDLQAHAPDRGIR